LIGELFLPMVKKGNVYGEWCNNEIHGKSCENRVKFMHELLVGMSKKNQKTKKTGKK
jgi:hypothetical protein